jgi:hypothetical protein
MQISEEPTKKQKMEMGKNRIRKKDKKAQSVALRLAVNGFSFWDETRMNCSVPVCRRGCDRAEYKKAVKGGGGEVAICCNRYAVYWWCLYVGEPNRGQSRSRVCVRAQ